MMPQREGSSEHSYCGAELAEALRTLSQEQRSGFILMQRLRPRRAPAVLVRQGKVSLGPAVSASQSAPLMASDGL